ncbi:MAG: hypothetical protein AAB658_04265, partial [Chloroflexota bacterium]
PVSITVDRTGFVWINQNVSDGGTAGGVDNLTNFLKSNTSLSIVDASWSVMGANQRLDALACNADGNDSESSYGNLVVAKGRPDGANLVWQVGHNNLAEGFTYFYAEDNNTASTVELGAPLPIDFYAPANAGLEENSNVSGVVDSAGNLHMVWVDVNRDARYARYTPANAQSTVHISSAGTFTHVSVGLASGTLVGISTDTVYIAMVNTDGDVFAYSASTSATVTGDWTKVYHNEAGGASHVSFAYEVTKPAPLPLVYGNANTAFFDWVITSTGAAPSLAGITITSSPVTAPYTTKTYTLQITNGSGFADMSNFDLGTTRAQILINGGVQSEISVLDTQYVSMTAINISVQINPPISNAGGPYDIRVINTDGQSYTLDNAFSIAAPRMTMISDPDSSDGKTSGAGFQENTGSALSYRTLTIRGSQFMDWGGTNTTTLEFFNAGVQINSVVVSTVTDFAPGAAAGTLKAHLKISTSAAAGGPFDIRLKNPTGQFVSLLSEPNTFYITIATAGITYPAIGSGLQAQAGDPLRSMTTGFSLVAGSMYFTPRVGQAASDGQASTGTQIKIRRVSDGYIWNPLDAAFQPTNFFTDEEAYFNSVSNETLAEA